MTNDAAGNVHYAYGAQMNGEIGINTDYGLLDEVNCTGPNGTHLPVAGSSCDATGGLQDSLGGSFAFGPVAGDGIDFFLYSENSFPNPVYRLGRLIGTKWEFETVPIWADRIAADKTGALLFLEADHIARRSPSGAYDSVAFPECIGNSKFSDLKTDATGAWFTAETTAAGTVAVSRRDPSGLWVTEVVDETGSPQATAFDLVLALGTLHLLYSRADGMYYARRVGSSWVRQRIGTPDVDPDSPVPKMAIDSCGAPHLVWNSFVHGPNGTLFWPVNYARWTHAGWRQAQIQNGQDPNSPGIAMTPTAAEVIAYDIGEHFHLFPF
jgi:hypothetical protein